MRAEIIFISAQRKMQGLAFQFWWLYHHLYLHWADPTILITKLNSVHSFYLFIYWIFKKSIYLSVLCLSCAAQDVRCIMWGFSLQCTDSLVVMRRLRCSEACRILVP